MIGTLEALAKRLKEETSRVGETAESGLSQIAREFGLATRAEVDEIELRLAQLEHRLRLLEHPHPPPKPD